MSHEMTKSRNHEYKQKVSIRNSINEKHKESVRRGVEVSGIEKVEVEEDN
jgi:hypothetical protein